MAVPVYKITSTALRKHWRKVVGRLIHKEALFVITQYKDEVVILASVRDYEKLVGQPLDINRIPEWKPKNTS